MSSETVGDERIAATLFDLLDRRRADATLCPSDVARALGADEDAWRVLMPRVRAVAATLAARGLLRVTRDGRDVDAEAPGGPIRLGRPKHV